MRTNQPLLDVVDLRTRFRTDAGDVCAVDGVSFSIQRGETLALVGESGCGKSVTALSIMRLIDSPGAIVGGHIWFNPGAEGGPTDLRILSERKMREMRGRRIAIVFQEPSSALNPVLTVGEQVAEVVRTHRRVDRRQAMAESVSLLDRVGIAGARRRAAHYPYEWSGGMQQRAMIAMAIACRPDLLIADEPTTALDVTTQAQVLDLLRGLQREFGMGLLFITHDLGVVGDIADQVCVMYAGRIVERAGVGQVFKSATHPYTRALLAGVPRLNASGERPTPIPGVVPNPINLPTGCRFHPRCALSQRLAAEADRETVDVRRGRESIRVLRSCVDVANGRNDGGPALRCIESGHEVACWEVDRGVSP